MKISNFASCTVALCAGLLIALPVQTVATDLLTTNIQAAGANWTAAIWKTNNGSGVPTGPAVAPVAGNTYQCIFNGTSIGNNLNSTRIRNPAAAGLQTFPGDLLTLNANAELRGKTAGAILNFPGVGGNPGLILNGGILNGGDDTTFAITGRVQVASQSYIANGANGGGGGISANRAFNFTGILSGSGNMVIIVSGLNIAQQVSNPANTFSGQWIVQCGWLLGNVVNSLGTNSITVDPAYTGYLTDMPNAVSPAGPARFEVNYDLNSAGVLTLINGGTMRLHQNLCFSAVNIEGNSLSAGTHFYAELRATYPASFEAGGSGSITVQPYGTPPSLGPTILTLSTAQQLFAGRTAHFAVSADANGAPPLTYRWRKGGVALSDGGNIAGATNTTLTVSSVSAGDVANYSVVVSNLVGSITSSVVALSIVAPSGEAYESAVLAANPFALYQLNETGDPATNNTLAFDYAGGYNGTYGTAVLNGFSGIAGPLAADAFSGFAADNKAAQFANLAVGSRIPVAPWNLNTNTVTITAWINPSTPQNPNNGLVICRGGGTVAGLCYGSQLDAGGNATLGYNWNNEYETYSWISGLTPPIGQWSFVALVVTPTNATIHLMNTNGLASATRPYNHVLQAFGGTTLIGDDSLDGAGARAFGGTMDDVIVFNRALSRTELITLFTTASAVTAYAPIILSQPTNQTLYAGQTALLAVAGGGSDPLTYQWQAGVTGSGVYTNLVNGGRISGSGSSTLAIANVNAEDALDYLVILANTSGSVTSAVANLTVQATSPAENITLAVQEAAGADWDTAGQWSDGNPASVSAASKPGSTYELLPGSRLRTPITPTVATFPGDVLTVSGDGVWNVNPGAGATISEIRFKQTTYGAVNGTVVFKKLVMNGGQLDAGADAGGNENIVVIRGEIDIVGNTPFNGDGGNDRGYLVGAWLTGTNNIEYHGYTGGSFQSTYHNPLNIAGTSNTFSGKWTVVQGVLLGSGPGSLGTNSITVNALGAFETMYDVNNTNANLVVSGGKVFLHQNDTFRSVFVNGVPLLPGTYTSAQLTAAYPTNFPATWTMQTGSTVSNASGSLTVLVNPAPIISQQPVSISKYPSETATFTVTAQGTPPLFYQWRRNGTNFSDGTTVWGSVVAGTTTTNLTIANVANADGTGYTVVITNASGSVTSTLATLTINPVGPAENITMSVVQVAGSDWNTGADWSDGLPASTSALSKPGSTYEVLPGARLRTPVSGVAVAFPGAQLTLNGDGVWQENGANISELRFKGTAGGSVIFPRLIMNGGQLDSGDNALQIIAGRMDVLTNAPIYADSASGQSRAWQIDAWLTGNGGIEFHDFNTSFTGNLNITGTSNTFRGTWNIVQGVLLGSGVNSLGTNNITIGAAGALETLYNINNPNGSLYLFGQMFLHQNDTFKNVVVGGTWLAPGTYTFAQLNTAYLAYFPANWLQQSGSGFNTGSGSITVLGPPITISVQLSGSNLQLTWPQGILLEADEVTGPWTPTPAAVSPFTINPTGPQKFYRIQLQ